MKKGLTLPNRQYEPYTDAEVAALWDLAPEVLVVLAYGASESESEAQHRDVVYRYTSQHPGTRIILRMYSGSEWATDPGEWASECAHRYAWWQRSDASYEVIPANEANIEAKGHETDWQWHATWLRSWAASFFAVASKAKIHLPALSPVGNWTGGLESYRGAGLYRVFDEVDVHAYGLHGAGAVHDVYEIFGPVCVTEFNQDEPAGFFDDVSGVADVACYFLLGGTEDQTAYDILRNPGYYASFKGWTMASNPNDSATVEREKIYAIWSLQRIAKGEDPLDKAAFASNVQALGGDPASLRPWGFPDQQTLSDQIIAKLRELKQLLGQV